MAIAIVLVLIVVASVLFHFLSPWTFTQLASNWGMMDLTMAITIALTGFAFIAVNLFIAYAVIRYRHREGAKAEFIPENKKLERWLIALTSVGIVVLLAPGLFVYSDFINAPKDALVVEALGQQWRWSFRFPGADGKLGRTDVRLIDGANPFGIDPDDPTGQDDLLVAGNEVHLPLDKPVKFNLRSMDVLHGFYVPQFRTKMDLVPGQVTTLWFTPTATGTYEIACAEYCGRGHHAMRGVVVVEEAAAFQGWLQARPVFAKGEDQGTTDTGADPLVVQGQQLALNRGCLGCHTVDGAPMVGPTWKGLFGKQEELADGTTATVDEAYLRESIVEPNARIVKGFQPLMPAYATLSDAELEALIAYIKSLAQ